MSVITIHQPEAFPWLGFFHKMHLADVFVMLDTVQFKREDVQNRNKINIGGKPAWLTIPIERVPLQTDIKDIKINWETPVMKKHLATLEANYKKHPYFNDLFPELKKIYDDRPEKLADFNMRVITLLRDKLGITTKIIKASELPLSGTIRGGTEVTLEICKVMDAKKYLSGSGGRAYLDLSQYESAGIPVYFQEFHHPIYEQKNGDPFVSHLSVLDLYFNHGPKSLEIILKGNPTSLSV